MGGTMPILMASKLLPLWMTDATFHLVNWETEIGRNLRSKIKELQNSYWASRQFNSHKGSASYIYTPHWDWCTTIPFGKCRNMMCFVVRSPHVLFCPCCICTSRTGPSLNMSSPVWLLLLPTLTAGQWIAHIVMPHLCILRQCIQWGYIHAKHVRLTRITLWCSG